MFGLAPRPRSGMRQQSKLQPPVAGKDGDSLTVGRRVRTHPKGLQGVVRYMGQAHFADGVWIGVELDTADGRNDGEVQGHRYFACTSGHGVFVRPENCVAIRGGGSTTSGQAVERRPRASIERSHSARKAHAPPENAGSSIIAPNSSFTAPAREAATTFGALSAGPDAGTMRKESLRRQESVGVIDRRNSNADDQIIGRLLASEAFSRVLSAKVADGVRTELAARDARKSTADESLIERLAEVENMVEEACGAMDDIAAMVQTISERIHEAPNARNSRDAAAGTGADIIAAGGGGGGGEVVDSDRFLDSDGDGRPGGERDGGPGGDAGGGGGGRDDARVVELTKLLCAVHRMSSEAAELLRRERRENLARISYLTNRVRDLEERQMDSIGAATTVLSEPSEG